MRGVRRKEDASAKPGLLRTTTTQCGLCTGVDMFLVAFLTPHPAINAAGMIWKAVLEMNRFYDATTLTGIDTSCFLPGLVNISTICSM